MKNLFTECWILQSNKGNQLFLGHSKLRVCKTSKFCYQENMTLEISIKLEKLMSHFWCTKRLLFFVICCHFVSRKKNIKIQFIHMQKRKFYIVKRITLWNILEYGWYREYWTHRRTLREVFEVGVRVVW